MNRFAHRRISALALCIAATSIGLADVQVTDGPTLTLDPSGLAPLSARIDVTTNVPTRAVLDVTDGSHRWRIGFPDDTDVHQLPLLGLRPDTFHDVELILTAPGEGALRIPLSVQTDPLPADFPALTTLVSDPAQMEPGVTLLDCATRGNDPRPNYTMAVDEAGQVVWFTDRCLIRGVRLLPNGNLLSPVLTTITETDMFGVDQVQIESEYPGDPGAPLHHELLPTPAGTYLSLARRGVLIDDFPTSETDPGAPTATTLIADEPVVEFAADGSLLDEWPLTEILDPTRIGYQSLSGCVSVSGCDWGHANAVIEDDDGDSLIVSVRHQDATVKFSRATGEIIWILAPHANWTPEFQPYLLQPTGAPFEWPYHSHAPMFTGAGTLVLFDNATFLASPFDGETPITGSETASRAVEYEIDEENMLVRQVWEYGANQGDRLAVTFLGDADWMPQTDNTLITFGAVSWVNGSYSGDLGLGMLHARIVEADHGSPASAVFDLRVHDPDGGRITIYRSERIPGLYPADHYQQTLDAVPAAPGSVGGGLRVDKAAGDEITLSWTPSCIASDADYEIYQGTLGEFDSHIPAYCSTFGETSRTFSPSAGDAYFIVVATNGADEGSHGSGVGNVERARGPSVCLAQQLATCP